jgi:RNA polymerase sigma-70 factor (ECF subfamily)
MAVPAELLVPPEAPPGSADGFEAFFRQHFGRVYGLLYRVTGNSQDAEDLGQELFLKLARRDPPIWQTPLAAGWLWKAAAHSALNALRGSRRRTAREERALRQELPVRLVAEREEDPASSAIRREQQESVRRALRAIPERDAMLLLARHSGLSYAEVAEALNLNPASVGTLLSRAEQRFKEAYQSQEIHDADI